MLKSFSAAISFLTVFKLPFTSSIVSPKELAASFACFPLAGLILGLVYYCSALFLNGHVPILILAVLISSLTVILTRGLHFDGLADFADGIWGGSTPERRLEIMKDSRSGAFGVLALIMAFSFKVAAIHGLLSGGHLTPLLLAPVFSRFAMAATAYRSTYARKEGLGKPFLENMKAEHLVLAALFATVAAVPVDLYSLLYFIPALCCAFFFKTVSGRFLGGITGDVLGAVNEAAEIAVLVLAACTIRA